MLFTHANIFQFLVALHLIGLTFGLGGASISDFTFLSELRKSGRISPETVARMHSFSQMVWLGLIILSLSGLGLIWISQGEQLTSPGFLAKMVVVGVLVANGLFLNFYATPRLATFSFTEKYSARSYAWRVRKLTFIFGAISVTSWYGAFFIAMFKALVLLPFMAYISVYGAVLGVAIIIALRMERRLWAEHSSGLVSAPQAAQPRPLPVQPPTNPVAAPVAAPAMAPPPPSTEQSSIIRPQVNTPTQAYPQEEPPHAPLPPTTPGQQ